MATLQKTVSERRQWAKVDLPPEGVTAKIQANNHRAHRKGTERFILVQCKFPDCGFQTAGTDCWVPC